MVPLDQLNTIVQGEDPENIDDLLQLLLSYNPDIDEELIRKAYSFSEVAHEGQLRRSGQPYISHPLGVAGILARLRLDVSTIITALLHDTVEDTEVTLEDIEENFDSTVKYLVDGVTKLTKMQFSTHP